MTESIVSAPGRRSGSPRSGYAAPGGPAAGGVRARGPVRHDVYTAGQLPMVDGQLLSTGKVGAEVGAAEAAALARTCALNALAAAASVAGGLSSIKRIVKVTGFVASTPDFTGQPRS